MQPFAAARFWSRSAVPAFLQSGYRGARRRSTRIILATGALLGLDAVRAAAEGTINSVKMVTRKPPNALRGPRTCENNINLDGPTAQPASSRARAPRRAPAFPANVNVAAALGLAGIGADLTQLEVWADPSRPQHSFHRGRCRQREFQLQHPECAIAGEPGTGKITALGVITCLRGLTQPLKVGS